MIGIARTLQEDVEQWIRTHHASLWRENRFLFLCCRSFNILMLLIMAEEERFDFPEYEGGTRLVCVGLLHSDH